MTAEISELLWGPPITPNLRVKIHVTFVDPYRASMNKIEVTRKTIN